MENPPLSNNAKNLSFVRVTQATEFIFCAIEILSQIKGTDTYKDIVENKKNPRKFQMFL